MTRLPLKPDIDADADEPDEASAAVIAARIDETPATFQTARDVAREASISPAKLADLLRRHYHTTPQERLVRARIELVSKGLIESDRPLPEIVRDAGFADETAARRHFRSLLRMQPEEYRDLRNESRFAIDLPQGYSIARALAYLGRDPRSRVQRVDGDRVRFGMELGKKGLAIALRLGKRKVEVELAGARGQAEAHRRVLRLLGLGLDPTDFERRMARSSRHTALIAGQRGLRVHQTYDAQDGLVWVIVGQQVSLASAFAIRGRLVERFGRRIGDDLRLPPDLGSIAESDIDELRCLGLSLRKAEYLLGLARQIADGELDLESLGRAPATRIERRLLACRGLGPWSVQYLMMRSFTLADCVPVGDVALAESLKRYFELDERPNPAATRQLMEPFAPHRSLATFHFWHRLGEPQ